MVTRQRPADLGAENGRRIRTQLGIEVRAARLDRGLTLAEIGRAVRLSAAEVSRIERGILTAVSIVQMARLLAVVGLELSAKAYPGPQPIRDVAQVRLLGRFHDRLHPGLRWGTEVPLPRPGDQRAWDALVSSGSVWRYGVEAETSPRDSQALVRRLNAKARDGAVDGVILVLPRTRRSREFLAAGNETLRPSVPVDGRRALELLAARVDPGGSAIVLV
jgi:transcriptional regulator with XRE-family HTH domain